MKALEALKVFRPIDEKSVNIFSMNLLIMTTHYLFGFIYKCSKHCHVVVYYNVTC